MSPLPEKRRKQEAIDRRRSLAGVPVYNENVGVELNDTPAWTLTLRMYPRRKGGFFSRMKPRIHIRRWNMDELGTFVADQIDGRRTVSQIIDIFMDRYNANRREAELSVVQFMRMLSQRQVISILVK